MIRKNIQTKGIFYIPEDKQEQLHGNLFINDTKIKLEILGTLKDIELENTGLRTIQRYNDTPEHEIIHGKTPEGYVTLIKDHFGTNFKFYKLTETTEYLSECYIGDEDFSNTKVSFKTLSIEFISLNSFVSLSNLERTLTSNKENKLIEFVVKAKLTNEPLYKSETDKFIYSFEPVTSFNYHNNNPSSNFYPIQERIYFRISKKEGSFCREEIVKLVHNSRDFFGFALNEPIYPTSIDGMNHIDEIAQKSLIKKNFHTQIFFADIKYKEIKESKTFGRLFTLSDISNNFGIYIEKWNESRLKYNTLHRNFFSLLYGKHSWEYGFLTLVTGIEEYIEKALEKEIKDIKKTIEFDKSIKEAKFHLEKITNIKVKEFLQTKLRDYTKDLIFKEKFELLINALPSSLSVIFTEKDLKLLKDIRNHIAHSEVDEELYKEAINNEIDRKLFMLAQACLISSIDEKNALLTKCANHMSKF